MNDRESNWKDDRVEALKESLNFFSNAEKLSREKWVVRQLLRALSIDFKEEELTKAEEPVDVGFRDARFQVKEILDDRRRRTDEFKNKLAKAELAQDHSELLERYTPLYVSFTEIVRHCDSYAKALISRSKYGPLERRNIDLLCYFNWLDYSVVPPTDVVINEVGFRSLSVVSNRYCAVVYASPSAPTLLRGHEGKAPEYFET